MWELLQKLENLWWKPYWKSIVELSETEKNVRLLTSLSSWLWQFVCKNGMIDHRLYLNERSKYYEFEMSDDVYTGKGYEYRLIEAALTDEDKLEQFLLDNIKIWNYES